MSKKIKVLIIVVVVIIIGLILCLVFSKGSINIVKTKIKKSYEITEASQEITPKVLGCEITLETDIKKIIRGKKDEEIELVFKAACGEETDTIKSEGIIKASPYTYTATPNENMQNYDLSIQEKEKDVQLNGGIYDMQGSWLSDINNGKAIINNMDINNYPDFQILLEDKNTIFIITKK